MPTSQAATKASAPMLIGSTVPTHEERDEREDGYPFWGHGELLSGVWRWSRSWFSGLANRPSVPSVNTLAACPRWPACVR